MLKGPTNVNFQSQITQLKSQLKKKAKELEKELSNETNPIEN